MCDERERLIEYVYGEATPADRQQIEAHLGDCHVCRAEVSGLRGVRDDLLAWDVPKSEPVWRPFVPPSATPARHAWPSWALATAAGALFTAGLVGGLAARGWTPDGRPEAAQAVATLGDPAPQGQPQQVSTVTPADLARLEAAILDRVRTEMAEQIRTVSTPPVPATTRVSGGGRFDDTAERLTVIEEWMDDQIRLNNIFNNKFGFLNSRTSSLSEEIELSRLQRISVDGGVR